MLFSILDNVHCARYTLVSCDTRKLQIMHEEIRVNNWEELNKVLFEEDTDFGYSNYKFVCLHYFITINAIN